MPNRLIKKITAKLVGAATAETFDIYDDTAVHRNNIYYGYNHTTDDNSVLDARCGKELADQINKFNLSNSSSSTNLTPSTTWAASSGVATMGSISSSYPIRWALSSDRTVGKVYGQLRITNLVGSGGRIWLQTPIVVYSTGSYYDIVGCMSGTYWRNTGDWGAISNPYLRVGASGGVYLSFIASNSASTYSTIELNLPACLYFFRNFGDVTTD